MNDPGRLDEAALRRLDARQLERVRHDLLWRGDERWERSIDASREGRIDRRGGPDS